MNMSPELIIALSPIMLAILAMIAKLFKMDGNAKDAVVEARQAKENTQNISNGFASGVDSKLIRILENQEELSKSFRGHLEWHLNQEAQK